MFKRFKSLSYGGFIAGTVALGGVVAQAQETTTQTAPMGAPAMDLSVALPPNAVPGECYARVFVPPRYEAVTEEVLVREASTEVEPVEPVFEWIEEQVLVEEGYEKLELVPALFDVVEERVLIKPASEKLVVVPAEYEEVEEQVLVKPAYTAWKRGRGLIERIDQATGEIMCLVEVPAEYATVTKRVVKTPPRVEKVEIPAEYQTVKKTVVVQAARTETVSVPPKYATVKVQKLVSPARTIEEPIPAAYKTVEKISKVSEGELEWRAVLCETNATPQLVIDIQRALQEKGYDPGPADGVIGGKTTEAVTMFQQDNALATGGLTMETIRALGVRI
jgi:hypothetical protein